MKIRKLMHSGAAWVSPEASIIEVARKLRTRHIRAIPVGENDRLIGIITDRDLICRGLAAKRTVGELTARDVMTKGVEYCWANGRLKSAMRKMQHHKIKQLIVLNAQNKRMVGVLTLTDLAKVAGKKDLRKLMAIEPPL